MHGSNKCIKKRGHLFKFHLPETKPLAFIFRNFRMAVSSSVTPETAWYILEGVRCELCAVEIADEKKIRNCSGLAKGSLGRETELDRCSVRTVVECDGGPVRILVLTSPSNLARSISSVSLELLNQPVCVRVKLHAHGHECACRARITRNICTISINSC